MKVCGKCQLSHFVIFDNTEMKQMYTYLMHTILKHTQSIADPPIFSGNSRKCANNGYQANFLFLFVCLFVCFEAKHTPGERRQ